MAKFEKEQKAFVPDNESCENTTNEQKQDANMTEDEFLSDNVADESEEDLKKELADLKDQHLRLIADFDNYRKRTLKEKADLIKSGGESVYVNLLPVIDDFERALKSIETSSDVDALKEGVHLIYEKFITFLNRNGVKEIPSQQVDFDTDLFDAVAIVPAPAPKLKNKVIDTIEKGYTLNDKVIRHAKVVVGE